MARPDKPNGLVGIIADLVKRVTRLEKRDAFGSGKITAVDVNGTPVAGIGDLSGFFSDPPLDVDGNPPAGFAYISAATYRTDEHTPDVYFHQSEWRIGDLYWYPGTLRAVPTNGSGPRAMPVPLVAPDVMGNYSVSSSMASYAGFVGAGSGAFWCIVATNGTAGNMAFQVTYPAQADRVLGTAELAGIHPLFGPVYRIDCDVDPDLDVATTEYGTTLVLQAQTFDPADTTQFRVLAAGWGTR